MRRITEGQDADKKRRCGRFRRAAGLAALCAAAGLLSSCSGKTQGVDAAKAAAPVPVRVSVVESMAVPVELRTFGIVTAASTVSVKAQVSGTLIAIHFQKGDTVKKDALLFEIDPRPFRAALDQAKASLDRDKVLEANSKRDAEREKGLQAKGYAPISEVEKSLADADALTATVEADKAAVENARLQLEYCSIRSPLDGRAGDRLVEEGNLVKANDMSLVVINQIRPIEVFFSVPQRELLGIQKYIAAGQERPAVRVSLPNQAGQVETGKLTFVDNAVDTASGTARLAGRFDNKDERLWPGEYVDVTLTLGVQQDATVAPARAVQTGRDGKYVFVITPDKTAELRKVTVQKAPGDRVMVEKLQTLPDGKKTGLEPGEQVVTDGQFRLAAGYKVEIRTDAPKAASGGPDKPATQAGKSASQETGS